ncbi:hypothetical protein [Flaviaesturariibacter aridisoli]|uniref:Uncharacterized protein n=1 Tax=Flaviaesturariibacter aridisoli TaxID=2545761 RepID=A0A4R4DUX1_9BACT|nr:hypothetical protein [Flaviaesturariibacter aridisoli]TCZ66932.1 hypothetical protein E0486_16425 [Flaviaesturariibacter aridisoli]
MAERLIILMTFFHLAIGSSGQTPKNICLSHGQTGFLKCYRDGTDEFFFDSGRFVGFRRLSGTIRYDDTLRNLVLTNMRGGKSLKTETVSFYLGKNFLRYRSNNKVDTIYSPAGIDSAGLTRIPDRELDWSPFGIKYPCREGVVYIFLLASSKRKWQWRLLVQTAKRELTITSFKDVQVIDVADSIKNEKVTVITGNETDKKVFHFIIEPLKSKTVKSQSHSLAKRSKSNSIKYDNQAKVIRKGVFQTCPQCRCAAL